MKKKLLIVRLDAIGDYILFRNFIKNVKESDIYSNHEVFLLCNASWYDLAHYLEKEYIKEFIKCDIDEYKQNSWYKKRLIQKLNSYSFETIVHPTYSRTLVVDTLINDVKATFKIGYDGDLSNISLDDKNNTDSFYTTLIKNKNFKNHEFEKNQYFFGKLLNQPNSYKKPNIKMAQNEISDYIEPLKSYAILSIAASHISKKWNIDNYIKVAQYIIDELGLELVLCGGCLEAEDALRFKAKLQRNFLNLVGKISLIEVSKIINKSLFIVSNDTGLAHIALALNKKTIVIMSGNHFGRFFPYPNTAKTKLQCVCPFEHQNNPKEHIKKYYNGSSTDINTISFEKVIAAINLFCGSKKNTRHSKALKNNNKTTKSFENQECQLSFSRKYNSFFSKIDSLKYQNNKYIVYGNGTIGKTIQALMPEKIVGYVDIADKENHPSNLINMLYDKIIISVLDKEEEIIKYLTQELNIGRDKIITLDI